jgi:hypothetical protein
VRGRRFAVACALAWAGPSSAAAEAPPVHTVLLRSAAEAVETPLVLGFDRRMTIVAARPIRLAVPGSPDVIGVTVKDRVAVVTLVDSPFVRAERPGTNLTLILDDGGAVALRLSIAARAGDATTDLVHLEAPPATATRPHAEALRFLALWAAGEAVPAEAARALEPARDRLDALVERRVLTLVARQSPALWERPDRDQKAFIYLAGDRAVRLGDRCFLRMTMTNRSQPAFTIGALSVTLADGQALAEAGEAGPFVPDPVVLPDERPRPLALALPGPACAETLQVRVCEAAPGERCVTLTLPGP